MKFAVALAVLCCLQALQRAEGKNAQEWKGRVIYQLLTDRFNNPNSNNYCRGGGYCGGTFQGVIAKLDYLHGLGVNAIWISPVIEQTDGGYHGYWAKNINAINSHFGSSDDLKQLVQKCHEKDIWVMVDVVANHMGYPPGCPGCSHNQDLDFSSLSPFNSADHYHSYCQIQDWGNSQQVEYCRLADLPDLNQDNQWVREQLKNWIKNLVQTYDFDGIRIDTIPEVKGPFWKEFGDAAGVFQIGEVDNGDPAYVGPYQNYLTATLNYPFFWTFSDVFGQKKSMKEISNRIAQERQHFKDLSVLGGFIDNHDNARFLHGNKDWTALKNALAYTLMAQWVPIVYYGTEQAYAGGNDPDNRDSLWPNYNTDHEMYKFIASICKFRNKLSSGFHGSAQNEKWADDSFYAFTRGANQEVLVATTNQGSGSDQQRHIPNLSYRDGQVLTNVIDPNDKVTAQGGYVTVHITNGQPKVYTTESI
ncbi:uncharacterized protein [Watersipora subatra]|uniref:uncharacterized protein n=1 Tax=Watersipora subatra TaxID=2589382 RepID=UPI00355BC6DC